MQPTGASLLPEASVDGPPSVVMPILGAEPSERTLYDVAEEGDGAEAAELARKARALDSARRGYMEESQRVISRQQDAIARLKAENMKLKGDLDVGLKVRAPLTRPVSEAERRWFAKLLRAAGGPQLTEGRRHGREGGE